MRKDRLTYFRKRLVDKQRQLVEEVGKTALYGKDQDDDSIKDFGDQANTAYNREFVFELGNGDRRLLREIPRSAAAAEPSETRDTLRRALQLRRQGNRRAAMLNLGRTGVTEELQKYSDVLTLEEFSQPGLPDSLLQKIVSLELALESGAAASDHAPLSWSQIGGAGATNPVPTLRLETLTEFDPRQCVYRDGRWTTP